MHAPRPPRRRRQAHRELAGCAGAPVFTLAGGQGARKLLAWRAVVQMHQKNVPQCSRASPHRSTAPLPPSPPVALPALPPLRPPLPQRQAASICQKLLWMHRSCRHPQQLAVRGHGAAQLPLAARRGFAQLAQRAQQARDVRRVLPQEAAPYRDRLAGAAAICKLDGDGNELRQGRCRSGGWRKSWLLLAPGSGGSVPSRRRLPAGMSRRALRRGPRRRLPPAALVRGRAAAAAAAPPRCCRCCRRASWRHCCQVCVLCKRQALPRLHSFIKCWRHVRTNREPKRLPGRQRRAAPARRVGCRAVIDCSARQQGLSRDRQTQTAASRAWAAQHGQGRARCVNTTSPRLPGIEAASHLARLDAAGIQVQDLHCTQVAGGKAWRRC